MKTINEVTVEIQEHGPPSLRVHALGEVPTGGYTNIELLRLLYDEPPLDGIQDFVLFADRPAPDAIVAQAVVSVKAEYRWEDFENAAPWLLGIRIHGAGDGSLLKLLDT